GARRPASEIVADVVATAAALDEAWSAMTPAAWDVDLVARSGPAPSWRSLPMRWREVEIHRVDLDVGYGPADWPATFVGPLLPRRLLPGSLTRRGRRRPGPRLGPGRPQRAAVQQRRVVLRCRQCRAGRDRRRPGRRRLVGRAARLHRAPRHAGGHGQRAGGHP